MEVSERFGEKVSNFEKPISIKVAKSPFFGSEIDFEILIMAKSHLDKWSDDDDGRFWLLIVFRLVIKSC